MNTFLVLILLSVSEGSFMPRMSPMESMEACEAKIEEVRKAVIPEPGIAYVLFCAKSKPTDGVDV